MGLWASLRERSCLRWRAREPRELLPFVFLALLARADIPVAGTCGAEGSSAQCLVTLRVLPQTRRVPV